MKREVKLSKFNIEDDKVIDFSAAKSKLAKAGGSGGDDDSWLKNLLRGTIFTARQKVQPNQVRPWICQLYLLKEKKEKSALLVCKTPEDKDIQLWVHILDFSRQNEFVETLAILEYEEDKEIGTDTEVIHDGPTIVGPDGDSSRAVPGGELADDVGPETISELSEREK